MSGSPPPYDPRTVEIRTFHNAVPALLDCSDTPRDDLERCLEIIEAREAADRSSERYREARPLSAACRSASRTSTRPSKCQPR